MKNLTNLNELSSKNINALIIFEIFTLSILGVFGLFGNLLMICSIFYSSVVYQMGNMFIVSLAATDALVSFILYFCIVTIFVSLLKGT